MKKRIRIYKPASPKSRVVYVDDKNQSYDKPRWLSPLHEFKLYLYGYELEYLP